MKLDETIDTRRISTVSDRIYQAYEGSSLKEGPRPYIGASILGHHCDRYIWLSFHWAFFYQTPNEGRMELLFKRGQREEEYVVHNLNTIGIDTEYTLFNQADVDYGCHVKGHPDGYLPNGVGEESHSPHNLEIKTHNRKSFDNLVEKGVKEAKPQHYCQMQLEMYGFNNILHKPCGRSLYYAVCKDDDRIYTERIALVKEEAEALIERGHRLALAEHLPDGDPVFECKWCPFHDFCFSHTMLPEINCRTCCHSTPKEDGTWYCEYWKDTIPTLVAQHHACDAHCIHPDLVQTWKLIPAESTDWTACYDIPNLGKVKDGIEGNTTTSIMRKVLNNKGETDEYIDLPYVLESKAIPDPNDIIPF